MKILISNDDGVTAPGIKALWELALEFADEVLVVAPDRGFSGMSHAITMHTPLYLDTVMETHENGRKLTVMASNGSPVDCIKLALDEIIRDSHPDLILSGINHGSNSNISVVYSGTMGAASEGAFYGIPSIGFSLCSHDHSADLTATVHYARQVIKKALSMPPQNPTLCWNVNVPALPLEQIQGVKFARQTKGVWREEFVANTTPHGRKYYWMNGGFINAEPGAPQADETLLGKGFVTILPVQMDLTDHAFLLHHGTDFEQ